VHCTDVGIPVVSLRRVALAGTATLEVLVHNGILSPQIATLLATCIIGRQNVLLCAGPGANVRPLAAALMGCAPVQELHLVVAHRGAAVGAYRPGTIVLTRAPEHANVVDAALAMGPDRIAVEDVQWSDARTLVGVVTRSLGLVVGVRARTAGLALVQLESMIGALVPRAAIGPALAQAFDVIVAMQSFADGISRVTQVAEPGVDEHGIVTARDIFTLVPGTRTWQFSGVQPRCVDDLTRREFRVDPAIFA